MSSRVFRKLQGDTQLDFPQNSDEEEEDFVPSKGKKKKHIVNPFDLVSLIVIKLKLVS